MQRRTEYSTFEACKKKLLLSRYTTLVESDINQRLLCH